MFSQDSVRTVQYTHADVYIFVNMLFLNVYMCTKPVFCFNIHIFNIYHQMCQFHQ